MIMKNNNENKILNVPNLRFPEFTGEWKKERLDEIAELSKGIGISKEQLSSNGNPCILYGELYTKYKSEIISEVISKTNIEKNKLKHSKQNDVIIPCSGETAVDIAVARCVPFDNVLLGGDLNIIRLHKYDGAFMAYQLNSKRKIEIAKLAQGVSVVHLYGENLKSINTFNPSLQEQQKIVRLLSLLDERIKVQNKIIEKLETLIKGIVVTHHRKYPYKQFVEISKLGKSFSVGVLSKEDLAEDGTPCILYGELFTTYNCVADVIESRTNRTDNQVYSKGDELLFPASTTVDAVSLITPTALIVANVVLGGDMFGIHINKEYNAIYISYILNYVYRQRIAKYAQGCTIIHLHYKDIKNFKLSLPPIEKQEKIVNTLNSMQEKIDCEKQNLRLLNDLRSFLLSKLFI